MERHRRRVALPLARPGLRQDQRVEEILASGRQQHEAGDLVAAEAAYRQVLELRPEHGVARLLLSRVAATRGDLAEACTQLEAASRLFPSDPSLHDSLGRLRVMAGQSAEAIESFRAAVALDPNHVSSRFNLGTTLSAAGELREAVPHLLEAVRLAPDALAPQQALVESVQTLQKYEAYQQHLDKMRASPYLEYPQRVHLETIARCNAACVFCPSPTLDRKGQKMSDALISKVLDDLTAIPQDVPFIFAPFKVNDPFMDVRIFDIMNDVEQRLPNARLSLTTNAGALIDKKLARLVEVKTLHSLRISVNDHRPDEYEALMKLPFKRTLERLDAIHQAKVDGRLKAPVILSRVGDETATDDEFTEWVTLHYPAFTSGIYPRGDWLGQVDTEVGAVPDIGCGMWFELSIAATGVAAHCCMDGEVQYPIGDVSTQHVLDVYNAPDFRKLRERTLSRRSASPCNTCTHF